LLQVKQGCPSTPQHRACCRLVEKERLDEWYIRNASLWLDLRIAVMTALMLVRGDRRTPHVEQTAWTSMLQINEPQPRRVAAHRAFVPTRMAAPAKVPAGRDPEFTKRPQLRKARWRLTNWRSRKPASCDAVVFLPTSVPLPQPTQARTDVRFACMVHTD
jgi:hypothetical protein